MPVPQYAFRPAWPASFSNVRMRRGGMTLKGPGRKGVLTQKAMVLNWRLCRLMTQAPGKAGSLRKLGKGILPASLSRGAEKNAACITCPAARKRAPFIQDYLSGNRKVVNFFPLRSMLEAKAFLLSPALLGVVISRKRTKQKPRTQCGACKSFQPLRQRALPCRNAGSGCRRRYNGETRPLPLSLFSRWASKFCSHGGGSGTP